MDDTERLKRGAAARRKVLGREWFDTITRSPWCDVWTRPHFDERTRRILVMGTMIALGRWDEFALHVRAALTEGQFSADDIKEILLQQAAYCGAPAGNHAFKVAEQILRDTGRLA